VADAPASRATRGPIKLLSVQAVHRSSWTFVCKVVSFMIILAQEKVLVSSNIDLRSVFKIGLGCKIKDERAV
jgi:hypothetical protein